VKKRMPFCNETDRGKIPLTERKAEFTRVIYGIVNFKGDESDEKFDASTRCKWTKETSFGLEPS
jgi:hypothetical protein